MSACVLVTGGAGYIGSHACKALAAAGWTPVAYDNLSRGHAHAVKWGPLVEGDILDAAALDRAFARFRPQAVLHFAAFAYVGESVERPTEYYRNNFAGALQLVEAMRRHGCDRLVFSSTCAVYGLAEVGVLDEDQPRAPINPYGRSKNMVEQLLVDCAQAHGLRSVSLRYFNCAGADPDGEIGEEHDPEPHLIPRALLAAAGALDRLEIYGTDYPTPDGTAVRDYIHVSDLANAHVAALDHLRQGGETVALNLGIGRGFSVREVVAAAERISGRRVPTLARPRRPGDPPVLVAEAGRARARLGWQPRFSDLDEIIATAWNWQQRRAGAGTETHACAG
jgi:UDP-arabinose 4-epimerase